MKILIISYFFPPFNAVGAIRAGKMAKYLRKMGHEVRVLTADNQLWPACLPVEIDNDVVFRTKWINVNAPIKFLLGGKKRIADYGYEEAKKMPGFLKKLGYLYRNIVNFPDGYVGWYPFAVPAGKKILNQWKPDFILSSSSPPTSFIVARKLSKIYGIPWVADLRDLWADNHNAELYYSRSRRYFDAILEKHILKSASALITVSDPLAKILEDKFDKPISVITNGFDLDDYPSKTETTNDSYFNIIYTGTVYQKKEDFSPFFEALSLLGADLEKVRVNFYGRLSSQIKKIVNKYGVENNVFFHGVVSYSESLQLQVNADLLLLLIFDSKKEQGTLPVKFFEYLGARRPVLLVGCMDGVSANLIRERKLGLAENNPIKIVEFLKSCLNKKGDANADAFCAEAVSDFSRQRKSEELVSFLRKLQNLQAKD